MVLGRTGALAGYPPANAVAAGPVLDRRPPRPARLEVTVDPARVGANELHLYLFDRSDGRQYDATKELTVSAVAARPRIAPIALPRARPARATTSSPAPRSAPGDWQLEVVARV